MLNCPNGDGGGIIGNEQRPGRRAGRGPENGVKTYKILFWAFETPRPPFSVLSARPSVFLSPPKWSCKILVLKVREVWCPLVVNVLADKPKPGTQPDVEVDGNPSFCPRRPRSSNCWPTGDTVETEASVVDTCVGNSITTPSKSQGVHYHLFSKTTKNSPGFGSQRRHYDPILQHLN